MIGQMLCRGIWCFLRCPSRFDVSVTYPKLDCHRQKKADVKIIRRLFLCLNTFRIRRARCLCLHFWLYWNGGEPLACCFAGYRTGFGYAFNRTVLYNSKTSDLAQSKTFFIQTATIRKLWVGDGIISDKSMAFLEWLGLSCTSYHPYILILFFSI